MGTKPRFGLAGKAGQYFTFDVTLLSSFIRWQGTLIFPINNPGIYKFVIS